MAYNWDYLDKKAYNNKVGKYKFKREFGFILKNGIDNFKSILDIAGGSGRFALPLKKYSDDLTVFDINHAALQLLNERDKSIKTILGDFNNTFIDDKFSLILCIEAMGYIQNMEEFFCKVRLLLNDNGRFIFTYHNPESWRFYLRKVKNWKRGYYNYNEMKLSDFKSLLNRSGFEITIMEGMNWIPLPLKSNSILVTIFESIEILLQLKKWHSQSPMILFSVKSR